MPVMVHAMRDAVLAVLQTHAPGLTERETREAPGQKAN